MVGGPASGVLCAAEAAEDLPADREVPVAEGGAHGHGIGGPGPALEHLVVVAPEDLRVLAVGPGPEPRMGPERRRRPFPHIAHQLVHAPAAGAVGMGAGHRW